jgi:hypothetical protein
MMPGDWWMLTQTMVAQTDVCVGQGREPQDARTQTEALNWGANVRFSLFPVFSLLTFNFSPITEQRARTTMKSQDC